MLLVYQAVVDFPEWGKCCRLDDGHSGETCDSEIHSGENSFCSGHPGMANRSGGG